MSGSVTHGAASARPQLHLLRKIADDRAKFALLGFPRRGRGQPQHQHLCAGRPHALDNFAAPEDRGRDTRRPGRCSRRASPRPSVPISWRSPARVAKSSRVDTSGRAYKRRNEPRMFRIVEDIRCSCAMRAGPRCHSSPTCASTGIKTSRSSSSGGRTAASRLICWSMAVASYFCRAAVSAAVSSGVRCVGATADAAFASAVAARRRSSASVARRGGRCYARVPRRRATVASGRCRRPCTCDRGRHEPE